MATRFRLTQDTTAPAVSPSIAFFSTHVAPATVRRKLLTSDSSALTETAYTPDASDDGAIGDALWCQFVSDPMVAGKTFTNGDAIKLAVQGFEANINNNLFVRYAVRIVSEDGTTLRRTLVGTTDAATELTTTLRNSFKSTTQSGSSYTTVSGDRLVLELGVQGDPGTGGGVQGHNSTMRFGSDGAGGDLPENDTETGTTFNPWFEVVPSGLFSVSFSASAVIRREQTAALLADAIIFRTQSASFTADAWITGGAVQSSFTADAVIKTTISSSFAADAIVKKPDISGSFAADAILLTARLASFTADAFIETVVTSSFSADAIIKKTILYGPVVVDTFTEATDVALTSHVSDSGHSWVHRNGPDITIVNAADDAVSWENSAAGAPSIDSVAALEFGDVDIRAVAIPESGAGSWEGGVYARQKPTSTYNALYAVRVEPFHVKVYYWNGTTWGLINSQVGNYLPRIRIRFRVTGVSPTRLQMKRWFLTQSEPETWLVDETDNTAALQRASGFVGVVGNGDTTWPLVDDLQVSDAAHLGLVADAVIKKPDNAASFTSNAVIRREQTASLLADAIVFGTQSTSFTADAVISAGAQSASFTADAVVLRTQSASLTADAILKTTISASLTADAIVLRAQNASLAADAIFFRTQSASLTADAVVFRTQAASFTADAVLVVSVAASFTADAIILRGQTASFSADAVLKATIAASFTADAVVSVSGAASFTADAIVLRPQTASLTADAIIRAQGASSFTADAAISRIGKPVWTTPANSVAMDPQPVLTFIMPVAAGPMHFHIELDKAATFDGPDFRSYKSNHSQTSWEYWDGDSWEPIPAAGVSTSFSGNEARLTITDPLSSGIWYRRVRGGA